MLINCRFKKKINDIDNFLNKLISDNKEKVLIEKEVTLLHSIISTLEYPERFKVIQNTKCIKKFDKNKIT